MKLKFARAGSSWIIPLITMVGSISAVADTESPLSMNTQRPVAAAKALAQQHEARLKASAVGFETMADPKAVSKATSQTPSTEPSSCPELPKLGRKEINEKYALMMGKPVTPPAPNPGTAPAQPEQPGGGPGSGPGTAPGQPPNGGGSTPASGGGSGASSDPGPLAGGTLGSGGGTPYSPPTYSNNFSPVNHSSGGTGYTGSSGSALPSSPSQESNSDPVRALASINSVAQNARRQELIDNVVKQEQIVRESIRRDNDSLNRRYENLTPDALADNLNRASDELGKVSDFITTGKSPEFAAGDKSELMRFRNTVSNARDLADLGLSTLNEEKQKKELLGEVTPFRGLLGKSSEANVLAQTKALSEIFGATAPTDLNTDLAQRYVKLYGLGEDEREKAAGELNLVENPEFTLPDGKKIKIALPHNGYILGGGKTGLDCSSLVSLALPTDVRKTKFTTMDFAAMWIYLKRGLMPKPPVYKDGREGLVMKAAQSFTPVHYFGGEAPETGDLLVYRLPWEPVGHVFIVKNYKAKTQTARVLEAAQSAGTIRERDFRLTIHPASKQVIPGLFGLRLKSASNKGCTYKEDKKVAEWNERMVREWLAFAGVLIPGEDAQADGGSQR